MNLEPLAVPESEGMLKKKMKVVMSKQYNNLSEGAFSNQIWYKYSNKIIEILDFLNKILFI